MPPGYLETCPCGGLHEWETEWSNSHGQTQKCRKCGRRRIR